MFIGVEVAGQHFKPLRHMDWVVRARGDSLGVAAAPSKLPFAACTFCCQIVFLFWCVTGVVIGDGSHGINE